MLALLAGLFSRAKLTLAAVAGVILSMASAAIFFYRRGKDNERVKQLEAEREAKAKLDERVAAAIKARQEQQEANAKNASNASNTDHVGGAGDNSSSSGVHDSKSDPYAKDPYRRD